MCTFKISWLLSTSLNNNKKKTKYLQLRRHSVMICGSFDEVPYLQQAALAAKE